MTDVQTKVRETFTELAAGVPVPPFDEVEFRSRVRTGRRRRTGMLVASAAAAASVAALTVPPLLEDDGAGRNPGVAAASAPELTPSALREPLYFMAGMRLMAATPDGEVHDLGPFESIVGSTAEGVLAVDTQSSPTWIAASSSGEGDGAYTFAPDGGPVELPDTGPVQSLALSGDGRYLAWLGLDDRVTVYDLKAGATIDEVEVNRRGYVTSVSEQGVLVSEGGRLMLYGSPNVQVPTVADGYGWVSDTAGDLVTVADRDDVTRVYDVTEIVHGGTARQVDQVPGTGRLAPYAAGIVSVHGPSVWLWAADGEPARLAGLGGVPQSAAWFDEDHALVTTAESSGTSVYVCPVEDLACTRVVFSEGDVRLAE
jgi:hypothetical protein